MALFIALETAGCAGGGGGSGGVTMLSLNRGQLRTDPPLTGPTVRILQHAHSLVGLSSEMGTGRYGKFLTL